MSELLLSEKMTANFAPIDEQHQQLIDLFNQFCQSANANNHNLIKQQFEEIINLVVFHFAFEHTLMLYTEYPSAKTYINSHNRFLKQVEGFYADFLNDKPNSVSEFIKFASGWIKTYLPLEASTYISYINEYFSHLDDSQKDEYLQNVIEQFYGLSTKEINLRMQNIFESYEITIT